MKRINTDKHHTFRTYLNDVEIKKEGIFGGYKVGKFRPDEPVTREQVAKVLALLYKKLKGRYKWQPNQLRKRHKKTF